MRTYQPFLSLLGIGRRGCQPQNMSAHNLTLGNPAIKHGSVILPLILRVLLINIAYFSLTEKSKNQTKRCVKIL